MLKNFPFYRIAITADKLLYCLKFACQVGSAGLGLVDTSYMIYTFYKIYNLRN